MTKLKGFQWLRKSIKAQIFVGVFTTGLLSIIPVLFILETRWQSTVMAIGFTLVISAILANVIFNPLLTGLNALETGLLNFKDGEFSRLLAYQDENQLGRLSKLYNQTAEQLRKEKQWIYQRELMLDKVLQSSPEALLLIDDTNTVVFSNYSARELFQQPEKLEGLSLHTVFAHCQPQLKQAIAKHADGLFNIASEEEDNQTWHLASGRFLLNNRYHTLYVFKHLTRELRRQEVVVWKKVIRIISHELNNSLGPMSSMLHSGKILTNSLDDKRLEKVFSTIEGRVKHLNEFIQGYGKFAKLPLPKKENIDWGTLIGSLAQQWTFSVVGSLPTSPCIADQAQLEQLLINLLKNAHESGSNPADISLTIEIQQQECLITVTDKGRGMNEQVMNNALIPFYSTKASGSGLGLALCREIVEAHNGHISIQNQYGEDHNIMGLSVNVLIPKTLKET